MCIFVLWYNPNALQSISPDCLLTPASADVATIVDGSGGSGASVWFKSNLADFISLQHWSTSAVNRNKSLFPQFPSHLYLHAILWESRFAKVYNLPNHNPALLCVHILKKVQWFNSTTLWLDSTGYSSHQWWWGGSDLLSNTCDSRGFME